MTSLRPRDLGGGDLPRCWPPTAASKVSAPAVPLPIAVAGRLRALRPADLARRRGWVGRLAGRRPRVGFGRGGFFFHGVKRGEGLGCCQASFVRGTIICTPRLRGHGPSGCVARPSKYL